METFAHGDPELGGFRPLPAGHIPKETPRADRHVHDPFGWEELGGPSAPRTNAEALRKSHGPRKRAVTADTKRTIIARFSRLRGKADWWMCRDLATELLALDLPSKDRAEALFALGYAQEKLGNQGQAIAAYRQSLSANADHDKSVRGLARLERPIASRA